MSVSILHDREAHVAALYCTTSDTAFGPVFTGDDPEGQADHFLGWLPNDPREYPADELERLHVRWLDVYEAHQREYA